MKIRLDGGRIVLAAYVVFLAVILVLQRCDVLERGTLVMKVATSWQLLLLVLGIMKLFSPPRAMGVILSFLGVFTMLPLFGNVMPGLGEIMSDRRVWIAVPVFVGVVLVISEIIAWRRRKGQAAVEVDSDSEGRIAVSAVMGAQSAVVGSGYCSGGYVSAVLASADVDMGRCILSGGVTELEVRAVLGSVTLKVPADWTVDVSTETFLGGVSDRRAVRCADGQKTLIVKAETVLGSVVIECA